jgi:Tfp pilus assembly protein PilN
MKLTLNLADRSYVHKRTLYLFYAVVLAGMAICSAVQGGLLLRLHQQQEQVETHLRELLQSKAGRQPAAELEPRALQTLRQEVALANDILSRDSFRWTVMLDRLEEVVQDGITIRSLQPDYREGSLRLAASARGLPQLSSFLDRLLASGFFSDVYLLDQASTKVKDGAGIERPAIKFSLMLKGAF